MPIESGTTISQLDQLWPLSGDFISEGDNHLRLIKAVLKAQFPGAGGQGFNTPIIATEQELNWLSGLNNNVQDQINFLGNIIVGVLNAPSGTILPFFNPSPPTGWTAINSLDNHMMRVVNNASTGGGTGGTDSPINWTASHAHTTGDHELTNVQMPSHSHRMFKFETKFDTTDPVNDANDYVVQRTQVGNENEYWMQASTGGAEANVGKTRTTGSVGGNGQPEGQVGQAHNHGQTSIANPIFAPKFANFIIASKD